MTGLAIMLLDISVGETAAMLLHPLSPPLLKHLLKGEDGASSTPPSPQRNRWHTMSDKDWGKPVDYGGKA